MKEFGGKTGLAIGICVEGDCFRNKNSFTGNYASVIERAMAHEQVKRHGVVVFSADVNHPLLAVDVKKIYSLTGYLVPSCFQQVSR